MALSCLTELREFTISNTEGLASMRIHSRLFLLSLLVPACFTVSAFAQESVSSAVNGGPWSDPSTWSGGAVPQAGDIVTIGEGMDVVLDVSPPGLNGMNLDGKLSFSDDADLELTTEWILLRGELFAGSERDPHTSNATITLTNNVPDENINGMGDRGILIVEGTLSLHGDRETPGPSWLKLPGRQHPDRGSRCQRVESR